MNLGIAAFGQLAPTYLAVFLMRSSFGLVVLTLPLYLKGSSNIQLGVIASSYPIVEMIFVPLMGLISDKIGRRRLIAAGLFLSSSVLFTFAHTKDSVLLTLIHGVQGLAAAMIVASSLALVVDYAPQSVRGKQMGFYNFANLGGYMVGPLAASLLIEAGSVSAPFYVASAIALVGALFTLLLVKDLPIRSGAAESSLLSTLLTLVRNRTALAMFPIWFVIMTFVGVGLTFAPRLLAQQGHRPLVAGVAFGGVALALALTQPFYGYLSDRVGRRKIMSFGLLSLLGLVIVLILSSVFEVPKGWTYLALGFLGIGSFAFAPAALATLADVAPATARGTTMGIYSFVITLGTIVGPLWGGFVLDRYGIIDLYYASAVLLVTAFLLTAIASRQAKSFQRFASGFKPSSSK